jgi:ice-binding like protein
MTRIRAWISPGTVVAGIAVLLLSATVGLALGASPSSAPTLPGNTARGCGQSTVPLGAAGNFRILAGTTVTNTGKSVVTGALGLSPGSATTGFPPGVVTKGMQVANTAAAKAKSALTTAYNNAKGRSNCPTLLSGNIGGKTLGPGLYVSSSALSISSGDLTLDAHGHSGAVFIFQISTKFTMTSGRTVILSGGARAANIFWVVGSSASLGTTVVLYGIILAHKSISMATGATLTGRALAEIGAVTLADNKVR